MFIVNVISLSSQAPAERHVLYVAPTELNIWVGSASFRRSSNQAASWFHRVQFKPP
ncbi:MAG: hypothetical protein JWQ71_1471 [Pedosphaera sp.]|nr:hypothetical protein [Pedosphaera sp.]